jgi:multiple sugar transport system substrate-binding protein
MRFRPRREGLLPMPGMTLTGMTWNHSRGYVPLVATAQRYHDAHPEVSIEWQRRSLQEFADFPIDRLAERFDLIVIDHPFVGHAAAHPVLLPLDEHLPAAFLEDQAANSVGASHRSYEYGGHQWALAIDAATPVSAHRPDVLARHDSTVPETWDDLLALARRGLVAVPAIPIDALMNVYMLCLALGDEPFTEAGEIVPLPTGVAALEALRELVSLCDPACLGRNPIRTYEAMITGDDIGYCPFAYGYSNYARPDYASRTLTFGGLVNFAGARLRSTLGGTGLAISQACRHLEVALDYAKWIASPEVQTGLFALTGGQPGHRRAWLDPELNAISGNYFTDTLATVDEAYLRPRYDGYLEFQDQAGPVVHAYLTEGGSARTVVDRLNHLYRESRADG